MRPAEKFGIAFAVLVAIGFVVGVNQADESSKTRDLGCQGDLCLNAEVLSEQLVLSVRSKSDRPLDHYNLQADCAPGNHRIGTDGGITLAVRNDRAGSQCTVRIQSCSGLLEAQGQPRCSAFAVWVMSTATFSGALRDVFGKSGR